jgi:DeoR/GlpR family transcriptional regulator of sugar metabolism
LQTNNAQLRLEHIRKSLAQKEKVSIRELAKRLDVSEMTIRRDFSLLESRGELVRTHGGAASAQRLTFEFTFRARRQENLSAKRAIVIQAARHVRSGQVVILDTGTTTLEFARELRARMSHLTVITTSLPIASELQFASHIRTVLLGGYLRDGSPDLHGPLTEQNLSVFQADVAFLGADAIHPDGSVYCDDLRVRNLDIAMAKLSQKTIILADSSKYSRRGMCKILEPEDYDIWITDDRIDAKSAQRLAQAGICVECAAVSDMATSKRRPENVGDEDSIVPVVPERKNRRCGRRSRPV